MRLMNTPQETGIWAHELFVKALDDTPIDHEHKQHAMFLALAALDAEARDAVDSDEPSAIEKLEVRNGFAVSLAQYLNVDVPQVAEQVRQIRAEEAIKLAGLMAAADGEV